MIQTLKGLSNALSLADPSDVGVAAALTVFALFLHFMQARFAGKGAAAAFSVAKWLAAMAALRVLDERVLRGFLSTPAIVLYCLLAWQAFRALLHDVYSGLYLARIKRRTPNRLFLNLVSFVTALVLGGITLRGVLDVDVSSILTSSAILTAVIGFSMQDTIGSLFSGLLIQAEKPFKIGDWIRTGDVEGQVTEVTWRYTKLVTIAQMQMLIPNNAIAKERLLNMSEPSPEVSITVNVPAPVSVPPVKVKSALEDVLRKSRLVLPLPPPGVRLVEIGLDQAVYRAAFSVRDYADSVVARGEVLSAVWYEFKKQRIEFPVSRRMVMEECRLPVADNEATMRLLEGIGLFEGLRPDQLELLVQCSALRTFAPETRVVQRGQNGTTMFIIASGSVSVRLHQTELSRLTRGDVFGEMALLTGEPRLADVVALEPLTCLELDREAFRGVLDTAPVLVANVERAFREREAKMKQTTDAGQPESAQSLFERFRRIFL